MGVRFFLIAALALAAVPARGQGAPGRDAAGLGAHRDTLRVTDGPLFRLRENVVPGSEALALVRGGHPVIPLDTTAYRLDYATGTLTLRLPPALAADSTARLAVAYRTLDLGLRRVYERPPPPDLGPPSTPGRPPSTVYRPPTAGADPLFGDARLRRSGSITRGIIAGSNRDVAVESGLRMELAGEVADGVEVEAVLTDENTPLQPEGTTQQLQEFDRVFVRLTTRQGEARLGDVDLAITGTEFAPLVRRVQGAAIEARVPESGLAGGRARVAAAAPRGLFQSQPIPAVEGVQGPYRLRGRQGEEFVTVIAGSERVYLDGEPLTRGENADYVVDYATGEITFTPRRLITAERRITVDFEYTAERFTRTLLVGEADAGFFPLAEGTPRLRLKATALREADASSFAPELGLSEADLAAITAGGDQDVLVDGAERVPFDPERPFVLYTRRDTTTASGQTYRIFVPATAAADSVFRVRFTRVRAGEGSYRRAGQAINGVLYEWAGPTGGDYIPFRLLPRPQSRRLVDLRAEGAPIPGLALVAEWAGSADDRNTLSTLDAADDAGQAFFSLLDLRPLALGSGLGTLAATARHRRRQATFAPLDRTRSVEFGRTWNLDRAGFLSDFVLDTLSEALSEGAVRWALSERSALAVEGGALDLGDGRFDATRAAVEMGIEEPGVLSGALPALTYRLDYARSRDGLFGDSLGVGEVDGVFLRQRGLVRRAFLGGRLTPSVGFENEWREQEGPDGRLLSGLGAADSLGLPASYGFLALQPGLAWRTAPLTASVVAEARREQEPLDGFLRDAADAAGVEADLAWRFSSDYTADARVAFRSRRYRDAFQALGRSDNESLALRWTARATPLDRAVEAQVVYEALTERAPLLQETYVLVGPELGTFVWRDGEGEPRPGEPDGVAQVDEFFPETTPLEGTYTRTFVPGDRLFPTVGVEGRLRLRLEPGRLARDPDDRRPLARALRAVQTETTVDVRERTTEDDLARVLLLDPGVLQQRGEAGATLAGRFRLAQDLVLFPNQPRYGLRFSGSSLTSTSRLAAGREVLLLQTLDGDGRVTLGRALTLRLEGGLERNRTESESFASRTFDIRTRRVEPDVTWAQTPSLSFSLRAALSRKTDALAPPGRPTGALVFRLLVEARLAVAGRLALTARAERADVRLDGATTSGGLSLFELTEGRGPGVSYLWGLTGDYTLSRYLRASLSYDGRAPADAPLVQTVRMQVSAVF